MMGETQGRAMHSFPPTGFIVPSASGSNEPLGDAPAPPPTQAAPQGSTQITR